MESKGMTQQQLAEAAGVNQASVHAWTKDSIPRGDVLLKVARTLGVPMESLLTGQSQSQSQSFSVLREEAPSLTRAEVLKAKQDIQALVEEAFARLLKKI